MIDDSQQFFSFFFIFKSCWKNLRQFLVVWKKNPRIFAKNDNALESQSKFCKRVKKKGILFFLGKVLMANIVSWMGLLETLKEEQEFRFTVYYSYWYCSRLIGRYFDFCCLNKSEFNWLLFNRLSSWLIVWSIKLLIDWFI